MDNVENADRILTDFYNEALTELQSNDTIWWLISQLLIDLYDIHLVTCCHCGAINRVESDKKYLDSYGDYIFDCVWCWQWIDDHDCSDLFY
jgi:hypothetical protein